MYDFIIMNSCLQYYFYDLHCVLEKARFLCFIITPINIIIIKSFLTYTYCFAYMCLTEQEQAEIISVTDAAESILKLIK